MTTPPLKCCEECEYPTTPNSNSPTRSCENCPCHTPPVEGEWEKEFDEKIGKAVYYQLHYFAEAHGNVPEDILTYDAIKSFITTLLHDEREKGRNEADWLGENLLEARESGKKQGRAEERERIAKMCEEMMKNPPQDAAYQSWTPQEIEEAEIHDAALSSLRDKLTTL